MRGLLKETEEQQPSLPLSLEDLRKDAEGWNGRWKRNKALEEVKWRVQQHLQEEEQARMDREAAKRQQQERAYWDSMEQEQKKRDLEELCRRERLERKIAHLKSLDDECKRRRKEALQRRRVQFSAPSSCEICTGSGKCPECFGSGRLLAVYLAPSVGRQVTSQFRGQNEYGCHKCGGLRDGSEVFGRKPAEPGTGRCACCSGEGRVWPTVDEVDAQMEKEEDLQKDADAIKDAHGQHSLYISQV